ncbi:MAG: hypothetical protein ACI4XL_10895 [Bacillus sp. (in: firmicutes)]
MIVDIVAVEAFSVILVIEGYLTLHRSTVDFIPPLLIIGAATLLNIYFIHRASSKIKGNLMVSKEKKEMATFIHSIGIGLVVAIPMVAMR